MKSEKTSKAVARKASKILRDKKSTAAEKSVAGSALTQAPDIKVLTAAELMDEIIRLAEDAKRRL